MYKSAAVFACVLAIAMAEDVKKNAVEGKGFNILLIHTLLLLLEWYRILVVYKNECLSQVN